MSPAMPGAAAIDAVAQRLLLVSEQHASPTFARIAFPEALDSSKPVFPVELISLYGLPQFDALPAETQWQLGLLETVNFFSLNIHGEQALVASMTDRLYRQRSGTESTAVSRYLQHFIHEENAHTYMLAEFCQRYHGRVMPEIVYRFDAPKLSRDGEDLLFFTRVYVLETLLDFVNRRAMNDETLELTARAVHRSHHLDETRHLAFGRAIIVRLAEALRRDGRQGEIEQIVLLVQRYRSYSFSRLSNPWVYRALSLPDPQGLARAAEASAHRLVLQQRLWAPALAFLGKAGLAATP